MTRNVTKQPVRQLLDGKTIAVYNSRHTAANATGVDVSSIRKVCRGARKAAGGFTWENAKLSMNLVDARKLSLIVQRNLDGDNIGLYRDVAIASKATGVKAGNIRYAMDGTRKTAGGFVWA